MPHVLLLTTDPRIIVEFETIAAVTGAAVLTVSQCTGVDDASRVFVDGTVALTVAHHDVIVVAHGRPGPAQWQLAAATGARSIIELPTQRAELSDLVAIAPPRRSVTVGIVPAIGGAGASTLAVALAAHSAKCGLRTALVDCAGYPGGLDVLAGLESLPGARWPQLTGSSADGTPAPIAAPDSLLVISGDVKDPRVMCDEDISVVEALRGSMDVVVLDLPVVPTRATSTLLELCDYTVVVTVNTVRATAATAHRCRDASHSATGIAVRMMPGARLDAMSVAQSAGCALWATLPTDARVVEQIEQGLGPAAINLGGYTRALAHLAHRVLPDVGQLGAAA